MKTFLVATAILAGSAVLAYADQPGPDWISASEVAQQLNAAGYTDIRKIEADDGYWKAHAVKDGRLFKVDLDPHTGKVVWVKPKRDDDGDYYDRPYGNGDHEDHD